MKKTCYIFIFVLLAFTCFWTCKSTQYSLQNPPETTLTFGDGGGFANFETGYALLENGQIFQYSHPGDTVELESIPSSEARIYYDRLKELRLEFLEINEPGRMYYFIGFTNPQIDHKVTWGAADYGIRRDILEYYRSLRELVKNKEPLQQKTVVDLKKVEKENAKAKKKAGIEDDTGW